MTRGAADPDHSWLVAGSGTAVMAGPERALADHGERRGRVRLVEPSPDLGPVSCEVTVAESGVRSFAVPWHRQADGRTVAVHPLGGNQVSWPSGDATDLGVTPAADAHLTAVHVRFVLRHLTTTLLEQDLQGRSIHAVVAESGTGVLAVAGPTRSGKTRLVNHLIAEGLVGRVVDDDCPVLAPGGVLGMLVPARHELVRAAHGRLRALVVLSEDVTEVLEVSPATAHAFLERTPAPWPAPWLPAGVRRVLPDLPGDLSVVAAPAQDESAFAAVAALVRDR